MMPLRHVLPVRALHDIADRHPAHAELARQHGIALAIVVTTAYFAYLVLSELSIGARFASRTSLPAPVYGVGVVVGWRASVEVIGPHALSVIAVMTDEHPFGDRPEVHFVGRSVREQANATSLYRAVSAGVVTSGPLPATVRFEDVAPEPKKKRRSYAIRVAARFNVTSVREDGELAPAPLTVFGDRHRGNIA